MWDTNKPDDNPAKYDANYVMPSAYLCSFPDGSKVITLVSNNCGLHVISNEYTETNIISVSA